MKVGILATGHAPRVLQPSFGDYPGMFERLLDGRGYQWRTFDVAHGDLPELADACDAYLVTGAAAGVYDGDPWIEDLFGFLRRARGKAKLVGVCFGHQAIAQAFGGQVIKSPKGWGLGLHTYGVGAAQRWMDDAPGFSLSASHQDQVVEAPPGATIVAGSEFCPIGMLAYGDEALSVQLHPEFAPAYSTALIQGRGDRIPQALAAKAVESLKRPDDHAHFAGWIAEFLER